MFFFIGCGSSQKSVTDDDPGNDGDTDDTDISDEYEPDGGQDAYYAKLGFCSPMDFTVNSEFHGESIVVNRNSGLEWYPLPNTLTHGKRPLKHAES